MRFIGCKTLLLENIKQVIDKQAPDAKTFCDIFSGTATVARYFKQWYEVSSNDLLYFSYVLQKATVENDAVPVFDTLTRQTGIADPIDYFNQMPLAEMEGLAPARRFFQNTYAPKGNRMYVTDDNALRIDFARNTVEDWNRAGLLSENEYFYLVACIVEGIPFVSNISGTYGAFHKTWERRSFKTFALCRLDVTSNGRHNRSYNRNGVQLAGELRGDILYIDPPYNSRQYLPNYHVLETAAKYDFPEVRGVTGLRPYEDKKSDFCVKRKVVPAFAELVRNADFRHLILSYSTDGLMPLEAIESVMKTYGKPETFRVYRFPYRRYKSRALRRTEELNELLVYIEKEPRHVY